MRDGSVATAPCVKSYGVDHRGRDPICATRGVRLRLRPADQAYDHLASLLRVMPWAASICPHGSLHVDRTSVLCILRKDRQQADDAPMIQSSLFVA